MDFYNYLKELSDEDLVLTIKEKINQLEKKSKEDNTTDIIGYELDYNPKEYNLTKKEVDFFDVTIHCFYSGYVRKGLKVVYGLCYDNEGIVSNDGRYYYIDDDNYLIDFCRFIRDKDIINEYELFDYILEFIRIYFGLISDNSHDREEMFRMIEKKDRVYYKPIKEHGLSWFKGKSNAMCSEYAIIAQNILSLFDIDAYLLLGHEKTGDEVGESHAFNIISYQEKETNKEVNALIDFANFTTVHDINFKRIGQLPYMIHLDEITEEYIKEIINNEKHICFEDYSYIATPNSLIIVGLQRDRDYYINNQLIPEKKYQKMKKHAIMKKK